jgi:hypothetical protein
MFFISLRPVCLRTLLEMQPWSTAPNSIGAFLWEAALAALLPPHGHEDFFAECLPHLPCPPVAEAMQAHLRSLDPALRGVSNHSTELAAEVLAASSSLRRRLLDPPPSPHAPVLEGDAGGCWLSGWQDADDMRPGEWPPWLRSFCAADRHAVPDSAAGRPAVRAAGLVVQLLAQVRRANGSGGARGCDPTGTDGVGGCG